MPSFALISEGLTDQVILERMIEEICEPAFQDGVFVNPLQPLRDATDKHSAPHGGWELVLEYCEQRAGEALYANDYVVVHIDTDDGDHPNFGVPLTYNGVDRDFRELVKDVVDVLVSRLGSDLYAKYSDRFLFAISIHNMESWLLLYMFGADEPKNSLDRINRRLRKQGKAALNKSFRSYEAVASEIKLKRLISLAKGENSLSLFLVALFALSDARDAPGAPSL
jgi:hypothetical protein